MAKDDQFDEMMRTIGVKRTVTRRAGVIVAGSNDPTKKGKSGVEQEKKDAANAPAKDSEAPALKREIASLEAALATQQDERATERAEWEAERTGWEAERAKLTAAVGAAQLQQQVARLCDRCPKIAGLLMVKVERKKCDLCGDLNLNTAVRQFLDACLVNGRLRILVVGHNEVPHALLRASVQDSRVKLTQVPSAENRPMARLSADVKTHDAVVLWDAADLAEPIGQPQRLASVGPVSVAEMLEAATIAIAADSDDH